jgi:ATP-dependent exoDNAse (exonuclease V) alpha subunit
LFLCDKLRLDLDVLKSNILVDDKLLLKIGCQVMCIVNLDTDSTIPIVNGSCGIVIDFSECGYPIVKFNSGVIRTIGPYVWEMEDSLEKKSGYGIKQIPLILSWAITIHKSQGCTLDVAEIDLRRNIFMCGQMYVALSRVRSLNGLYLLGLSVNSLFVNNKVLSYYNNLQQRVF